MSAFDALQKAQKAAEADAGNQPYSLDMLKPGYRAKWLKARKHDLLAFDGRDDNGNPLKPGQTITLSDGTTATWQP